MAVGQHGNQLPQAGIIIQARMDSTRLPGKSIISLGKATMLDILVKRLETSGLPIILATSTLASNDALEVKARELGIVCHRGSEDDVLTRFYDAAKTAKLDVIVRATGDNPLLDGKLVRKWVDEYIRLNKEKLFMSTVLGKKTLPLGITFEIFNFGMLEDAWRNAATPSEREHVTPYFFNMPGRNEIISIGHDTDKSFYRLSVDTEDDLKLMRTLINQYNADELSVEEIIAVLDGDSDLANTNVHIEQKKLDN